jgi:phosphoglycerol transferase MdoB-like AlkP superfamily enzyme
MTTHDFSWFYLIFFLIPLARIVPRLIRKWRNKDNLMGENQFNQNFQKTEQMPDSFEKPKSFETSQSFEKPKSFEKPLELDMQVLSEINNGVRDFNQIQKNTEIDNKDLENILADLEKKGLMKVVKKSGLMGNKVEIHPTEKGFKKFYT